MPNGVQHMAVCFNNFKEECNRTTWMLMRRNIVNNARLPVFYTELPKINNSYYKLKWIYPDNSEGDQEQWQKTTFDDIPVNVEYIMYTSFTISCIILLGIVILILELVVKNIKRRLESSCTLKINT